MEKLRADSISIFDCPELQNNRVGISSAVARVHSSINTASLIQYDLRAVLYQDGFFGRTHIYSYVKDYETGVWWKTVDHDVTEVRHLTSLPFGLAVS